MKSRRRKKHAVKKTISLAPEVFALAQKRAVELNRNFSNFISTLIEADAEPAR